jgi:hypothetical protein
METRLMDSADRQGLDLAIEWISAGHAVEPPHG